MATLTRFFKRLFGLESDIPPNTAAGAGGSGSGGGGSGGGGAGGAGGVNRANPAPTGPAPLVGQPEFLPQHTFISAPLPGDNGFIANAVHFHQNAGLNPRTVGSLEEVLELLANTGATGSGVLDRIRIVSHFFVADGGEAEQLSNLGMNFLRNGARGVLRRQLEGFAESSIAGLRAMIAFDVAGRSPLCIFDSPADVALSALRSAGKGAAVDAVFPSGSTPSPAKEEFVVLCGGKWILAHDPSALPDATIRTNLGQAYDVLLADLKTRLVAAPDNVPAAALDALAAAISGLTDIAGAQFVIATNVTRFGANVAAGLAAHTGDSFRNKLLAVRPRFDRYTTIDIRGCQAGRDVPYLAAIQRFFGQSNTVRPVVTAPNIFQRFNQIGEIAPWGTAPQNAAAAINGLFNSGFAEPGIVPYTAANVRSQFETWANGFGITTAHLDFWHTTFQMSALEFSTLAWRASIPSRNVVVPRLDALASVALADIFNRLGEIFFIRLNQRPSAAETAAITPLQPNLSTWVSQLNATIAAGATPAQLTTHFNNFKTIYEAVDTRMANASFHNSPQRVIPPTQPAGMTAAQANTFQSELRGFVQTHANSKFAPVRAFLTAADALTRDAPARMRYHLGLGLVFQLANTTDTSFNVQRVVVFNDRSAAGNRRDEAIRHWMRSAWRGVAPPTIDPNLAYDLARHSAWLVEGRTQGPSNVCPHPGYMSHIVTQPA